jgi:hypothetical protein
MALNAVGEVRRLVGAIVNRKGPRDVFDLKVGGRTRLGSIALAFFEFLLLQ